MKKAWISILLALCAVVAMVPAALLPASAEELTLAAEGETDYDSLYVKEGLEYVLSSKTGVDLTAGTWTSTNGEVTATLVNPSLWLMAEDGGLEYRLGKKADSGIDLGIANLPTGNYTVAMTAMGIGFTKDDDGDSIADGVN